MPESVVDGTRVPRFSWLTWGQHTSSNAFAHCSHVFLAGVLHRDRQELAAEYIAQTRDLTTPMDSTKAREVEWSEVAHAVYQAASRGAMRQVSNGFAHRMTVWLIAAKEI